MRHKIYIIALLLCFEGCYSYWIIVPDSTPVADSQKKTIHSLAWGLINDPQQSIAVECVSNSIHEVKISTNIGYVIITVFTLGFWMPIDVEWKCGPQKNCDEEPL